MTNTRKKLKLQNRIHKKINSVNSKATKYARSLIEAPIDPIVIISAERKTQA